MGLDDEHTGPNSSSAIPGDDLAVFAAGRLLGLALLHGQTLGISLTPALVKLLAEETIEPAEVAALDPQW
eukprot:SAG31_NODE_23230_length_508_cov_1.508557_1_plen_69_part_01